MLFSRSGCASESCTIRVSANAAAMGNTLMLVSCVISTCPEPEAGSGRLRKRLLTLISRPSRYVVPQCHAYSPAAADCTTATLAGDAGRVVAVVDPRWQASNTTRH